MTNNLKIKIVVIVIRRRIKIRIEKILFFMGQRVNFTDLASNELAI
jgi:hypothetical protein